MAMRAMDTVWYPALKQICTWFNYSLTKTAFKTVMKTAIPVVGFVLGGTITYFSFGPCCNNLKKHLKNTIFSNPNYVEPVDDEINIDDDLIIEVPSEDIAHVEECSDAK